MNKIARHFVLAGSALVLMAARLEPQENPCLTRTLAVNVMDNEDEAVTGLNAAQFRGKFQGRNVEIISAEYNASPRKIVFVVDSSSAMPADQTRWRSEVVMAEGLVSWLSPQSPVALVDLGHQSQEKVNLSQDRNAVNAELARIEMTPSAGVSPQPKTALIDGLLEALAMLGSPRPRDTICLISDGGDAGVARIAEVEQKLLAAGVRLFGLLPEAAVPGGAPTNQGDSTAAIRDLIKATGGDFLIFTSSPKDAANSRAMGQGGLSEKDRSAILVAARGLAQEINEVYLLRIKLPEAVSTTRDWELEAKGEKKSGDSELRVIYPKRLAKCP